MTGLRDLTNGVTFPTFRVSGMDNVMNGVTFPELPSGSIVKAAATSLTQGVTVPSVPATVTATTPSSDSNMNWLWLLAVIPVAGVGLMAMSKN
jgi:hypothetical protein